jgi:hypothetical protein
MFFTVTHVAVAWTMPKIVVCLELIDSEYVATLKDPRPDFHTTGIVPEWQRATAILANSIYGWCLSWPPVTCCLSSDDHPGCVDHFGTETVSLGGQPQQFDHLLRDIETGPGFEKPRRPGGNVQNICRGVRIFWIGTAGAPCAMICSTGRLGQNKGSVQRLPAAVATHLLDGL